MFNNVLNLPVSTEEVPVTEVHFADKQNPAGTVFWVVESNRGLEPKYWAGYFFDSNFDAAIRLCREIDARAIRSNFSEIKDYRCVRHIWL